MSDDSPQQAEVRAAWLGGDQARAIRLARDLVEREPDSASAQHLAGVVSLESSDYQTAQARLRRALELAPDDARAMNDLGRALLGLQQPATAATYFAAASRIDPAFPPAHFNLGIAKQLAVEPQAAIAAFRRAIDRDNRFVAAHQQLIAQLAANGDTAAAAVAAVAALAALPDEASLRWSLVNLLARHPTACPPAGKTQITALLEHPQVNPQELAAAGWHILSRDAATGPAIARGAAGQALARLFETEALALALIREALPPDPRIERLLTGLRRWLLCCGRHAVHPDLCSALVAQCQLNGGAWPVTPAESAQLAREPANPLAGAYPPPRQPPAPAPGRGIAAAIRSQYERHPYPQWRRLTIRPARRWEEFARESGMGDRDTRRLETPTVLVAGCGTGRHAAAMATAVAGARVTAIDISAASLAYARGQCAAIGLNNVAFQLADLRDLPFRGHVFDHIECGGVLHHLRDPEAGWQALASALSPGGTMRIAVYSRLARQPLAGARAALADLRPAADQDQVLRTARARLLALPGDDPAGAVWRFVDAYSLSGFRDLLFNAHEDPFDIDRIARALDRIGLAFLGFDALAPQVLAAKRALFPDDPEHRSLADWAHFEELYPETFSGMYHFWCARQPV